MSKPPRRPLGRSGLSVAPFAFGGNVLGWTVNEATGFELLDRFVDAGFNLIDTADVYSTWVSGHVGGESESILGRWLAAHGRREEVLVATKVGMDMGPGGAGLSPEHIRSSIAGSLARLQTDRIDLYQAHIDDPSTPLESTLGALSELIDTGSVTAIGASNYAADRLEEALQTSRARGLARFESLQPRYNLMDRAEFEDGPAGVCERHGLGVLTYSSLASGFLSGKYRESADLAKSPRGARAAARLTPEGLGLLNAVDSVAERHDCAPSTVALAWLLTRPIVTAPIASATSVGQLEQLIAATDLTLTGADRDELERAGRPVGTGRTARAVHPA